MFKSENFSAASNVLHVGYPPLNKFSEISKELFEYETNINLENLPPLTILDLDIDEDNDSLSN